MHVNADRMLLGARGGFMAATDLADHLVGRGVPFRDAHEVIGKLVLDCERSGRALQDLTAEEYVEHDARFGPDVLDAVDLEKIVARRVSAGGTGHSAVQLQMQAQRDAIAADEMWLEALTE